MSHTEALKDQTPIAGTTSQTSWIVLRFVIGALLAGSGLMKAHMLATQPIVGDGIGILNSRWLNILAVELELAFAVWLFAGLAPRLSCLLAFSCFIIFALISASKWYAGAESCHCFGAVTTPPIYTFLLDLLVIGLLVVFRPRGMVFHWKTFLQELPELKRFKRVGLVAVVWLILAVPVTYAMMSVTKNDLAELGTEFIGADGRKTVLLDPDRWIGKTWPLLPYIEPSEVREKLKTGKWTVVLYHHDCQKCKEVIDDLIEKKTENLVCVAVPPLDAVNRQLQNVVNSSIDMKQQVFVETPVVLSLANCFVGNSENCDLVFVNKGNW